MCTEVCNCKERKNGNGGLDGYGYSVVWKWSGEGEKSVQQPAFLSGHTLCLGTHSAWAHTLPGHTLCLKGQDFPRVSVGLMQRSPELIL